MGTMFGAKRSDEPVPTRWSLDWMACGSSSCQRTACHCARGWKTGDLMFDPGSAPWAGPPVGRQASAALWIHMVKDSPLLVPATSTQGLRRALESGRFCRRRPSSSLPPESLRDAADRQGSGLSGWARSRRPGGVLRGRKGWWQDDERSDDASGSPRRRGRRLHGKSQLRESGISATSWRIHGCAMIQ